MGVSLLYHLAKAGWKDIVLVEKNDLTHGSTWHAAGLCTHFAHNPTIQELRATSVRLYRDVLPKETGLTCGFHPSGAMRITRNPDRMDEFKHVAGLSDFTGYPLEILTPERIAELHPLTQLDGLLGGIYEPDDGHVDPTMATNAMAQVAVQNGAKIQRYNPVNSIRKEGHNWIVETKKDTIRTKHLVNAAGTWGWEIGHMMGLNIPSVPVLHQYLVTDAIPEVHDRIAKGLPELPMIRDPEESWYVRQERDGLILGPYEKEAQVWSVDGVPPEFGADLMPPDLDRVEHIIEAAMARVPALGDGGVKSVVNGPITFTPDANPLIGPAHGLPNAWLLTGSSMGVMEGGGAGWFLAHWMTHGAPPMDPLAVDSRRFWFMG
ncbi:Dimethylglycine dehydrogenase, mitochondrial [Nymphon striatum]|nr:Dimethylglycine dehydrogenase, mitochondrial [Nymphon striatum]